MDKLWLPGQLATFSWSSFPVPVTLAEVTIVDIGYGENHEKRSEGVREEASGVEWILTFYSTTFIQWYPWWQGGQQVEGVVVVHKDGIPIESSMEKSLTVEVNTDTVMAWAHVLCIV